MYTHTHTHTHTPSSLSTPLLIAFPFLPPLPPELQQQRHGASMRRRLLQLQPCQITPPTHEYHSTHPTPPHPTPRTQWKHLVVNTNSYDIDSGCILTLWNWSSSDESSIRHHSYYNGYWYSTLWYYVWIWCMDGLLSCLSVFYGVRFIIHTCKMTMFSPTIIGVVPSHHSA